MLVDSLAADSRRAPFQVHSIRFHYPGSPAIGLKDHITDDYVSIEPEWVANPPRDEPAAYVRGTQPPLRVVFHGAPAADGTYTIGADGTPIQVEETRASLTFDPQSGLSVPITFQLKSPLPSQVGRHATTFDWFTRDPTDRTICLPAGQSLHRIYTTWRAMRPDPTKESRLYDWVYKQLMEWTCEWAAGQDDEKGICDAIISNLPMSGLKYGVYEHKVRDMLRRGGGMCGGWYQLFQQMAHCQGVFVHRRRFLVDWRVFPNGEDQWCAIVIRNGGLNQPMPTFPEREFHDNDTAFPITAPVVLVTRREPRYCFWGSRIPDIEPPDGHCINFLVWEGRLYLYDACFGAGPIEIEAPLPPDDSTILGGAQLSSFKARYLDMAVDYMLGTLYNGSALCGAMTVKTPLISDVVNGRSGITFFWGP